MDINDYYLRKDEKPLDRIVNNGGFCGIFRTICCIGDSLSSGEFETIAPDGKHSYYDIYEQSWGQYIARMTGSTVYNFSKGGMTAKKYCSGFADENAFWSPMKAAQAYIIALGVNDMWEEGVKAGCIDDTAGDNTFAGFYGTIIQRLKRISPDAKLFFVTQPREESDSDYQIENKEAQRKILDGFAGKFTNSYVLDLYKYAPVYDKKFKENFFFNGHMNAAGYRLTADIIASYIDYIIRSSPEDFTASGLIGAGIDFGVQSGN